MAHFAKIIDGKVFQVIVAEPEFIEEYKKEDPMTGPWIQCSYNTRGGIHYVPDTNPWEPSVDQTKALRKNYPAKDWTYDEVRDAFIPPKPFNSWVLNEETCLWEAPVAFPDKTNDPHSRYTWNEELGNWEKLY